MQIDEALRTAKDRKRPVTERIEAVAALGRSDDPRAPRALQDALEAETDSAVRDAIARALRQNRATVLDIKRPKLDRAGH